MLALLAVLLSVAGAASATSLGDALSALVFENEGLTSSDMRFVSVSEPCSYLEPESPTRAEYAWSVEGGCPYMYLSTAPNVSRTCTAGAPSAGMDRPGSDLAQLIVPAPEADPAGWCSAACCNNSACYAYVYAIAPGDFGACERGQRCCYLKSAAPKPVANPKCQAGVVSRPPLEVAPPPLGMRSAPPLGGWTTGSMELRADGSFREVTVLNQSPGDSPKWARQDGFAVAVGVRPAGGAARTAALMQTHPPAGSQGVAALRFSGAYPVTRLTVAAPPPPSSPLPPGTSLYAFGRVVFGNLTRSANPAITLAVSAAAGSATDMLVTVPLAEQDLSRLSGGVVLGNASSARTPSACLDACNANGACRAWTLDPAGTCVLLANTPTPLPVPGSWSGTPVVVTHVPTPGGGCCAVVNKTSPGSMQGQLAACVAVCGAGTATGTLAELVASFSAGTTPSPAPGAAGVPVAAAMGSPAPGADAATALGAITWHLPGRAHTGLVVGNRYTALHASAADAAAGSLDRASTTATVTSYAAAHAALRPSHMPVAVRDAVLQMLNHFRMPIWTADDRVRSFEAYDCVNIDSVHNDGERAVPYLMAMPHFAESKLRAWAAGQTASGMIQEQLGCGCQRGVPPLTDKACGRVMSDVSSMFLVYLVHMAQGGRMGIVKELWPNAVAAAKWQIDQSAQMGVPLKLQTTYDVLGLNAYDTCTYSSLFHILAMRSCSFLAGKLGDAAQGQACDAAATRAQDATDARHWVEDGGPPPPGAPSGPGPWPMYRSYCDGGSGSGCPAGAPNATMADSTYPQVIAYTLGFGSLVRNETRLRLHLQTVMQRHMTPYGMLVMVGRELPYPGSDRDNAVWMMSSPNWASLAISSGLVPFSDVSGAWPTLERSLSWWRGGDTGAGGKGAHGVAQRNPGGLNDLWNIAGVVGGVNNTNSGAPWITSHYGYTLTAWRAHLALSGQVVDLSEGSYQFDPKPGIGGRSGTWPVIFVGGLGSLSIDVDASGAATATIAVVSGPDGGFPLSSVRIGQHTCQASPTTITPGSPFVCHYNA